MMAKKRAEEGFTHVLATGQEAPQADITKQANPQVQLEGYKVKRGVIPRPGARSARPATQIPSGPGSAARGTARTATINMK